MLSKDWTFTLADRQVEFRPTGRTVTYCKRTCQIIKPVSRYPTHDNFGADMFVPLRATRADVEDQYSGPAPDWCGGLRC